jgi:hypothetical protein
VFPRRLSAALNDDLVDIGNFQQLATNGVKACSSQRARCQAVDVDAIQAQSTFYNRGARQQIHDTDRRGDDNLDNRVIGIDDLDRDLIGRPYSYIR